jgi:N-acyl-D-aspartate/D-glutamate deacylase
MADYDLVIRGGTLVDGTGAEGSRGDLGIKDGKIVALGEVKGSADNTLEADDHVVCPGFVDIHTHYDAQVFWDRMLSISPWHGVTSVVAGNCGFGIAPTRAEHRDLILRTLENVEGMSINALREGVGEPDQWPFETFPQYLDAIEQHGVAINFGALVGHTPVRMYVMGEESTEREATAEEIAQMKAIVADAIAAGAIGFATSKAATHVGYEGRPVPSRAASFEEIETLARCLGEAGRGTLQVTNGRGLFLDEFETLQKQINRPISWTALLQGMGGGFGKLEEILERSQSMQERGVEVYPQVMPRPLNFEFQFKTPFIFEAYSFFKPVSKANFEGRKHLYADPDFRAKFKQRAERGGGVIGRISQIAISWFPQPRCWVFPTPAPTQASSAMLAHRPTCWPSGCARRACCPSKKRCVC